VIEENELAVVGAANLEPRQCARCLRDRHIGEETPEDAFNAAAGR
jgi:hypothetical protein